MTTAERIKQRRLELGLTQLEVAKRMGLTTKAAVCKIEKQGNDVTLKSVEKFASALHCAPAYLMGWSNEKYDSSEHENNRTAKVTVVADFSNNNDREAEREKQFIKLYSRLQDSEKDVVDKLLESLTSDK